MGVYTIKSHIIIYVLAILLGLISRAYAAEAPATYDPSTKILNIPALQINTNLRNVTMSLGDDGCLTLLSNESSAGPFTGATYNPATQRANLPIIDVNQFKFSAVVEFSDGCFRATELDNVTGLGDAIGANPVCPVYMVGDQTTFTTTIVVSSPFTGDITTITNQVDTVISNDLSTVVVSLSDSAEATDTTATYILDSGRVILSEERSFNDEDVLITSNQVTQNTICPVPAVGTQSVFQVFEVDTNALVSTTTTEITAIEEGVSVTTPAGTFTATRVDSTSITDTVGFQVTVQNSVFYVDSIGVVKSVATSINFGVTTMSTVELTSTNISQQ